MHDTTSRGRRTLGAIGAIAFLIAACGSSGGGATTAATQPTATEPAATGAGATAAAEAYEVELADNDTLGKYLTGEDGKTLYLFTPDTTSASNCNGDCAASWPPFTLDAGETVKSRAATASPARLPRSRARTAACR
jgi:predicted lipoprotein with Yx(FWY)xxD motif